MRGQLVVRYYDDQDRIQTAFGYLIGTNPLFFQIKWQDEAVLIMWRDVHQIFEKDGGLLPAEMVK